MTLPDRVIDAGRFGGVLVLCRHAAARRLALRALLEERRAWPHVEVATLGGALAARTPESLVDDVPDVALSSGHPWAVRLAERPQLLALLTAHVERAHRQAALGGSLDGLPAPLASLVEAGWGRPRDLAAWEALARTAGPVVPVGFVAPGGPQGGHGLAERLLLRRLGIDGDAPEVLGVPVDACEVADVAAEARAAVAWLRGRGGPDRLVLYHDPATADRFACAARRNGLTVADEDADSLAEHALVRLLQGLVPLFASRGAASLPLTELHHLMTHPVLSRRAVGGGEGTPAALDRLSLGHARTLLGETRRSTATPEEWARVVSEVAVQWAQDEERPPTARSTAIALRSRVEAVARRVAVGTLGSLADLVTDLGLSRPDDRIGVAIRGALRKAELRPASDVALQRSLEGALDVGELREGITLLRYDAYDGRASRAVVLLDVHHKGLGAAPGLDPILGEAGLRALGLATPSETVAERLVAARWAAARSGAALAVVTHHDATGRAVIPPAQLAMRFHGGALPGAGRVGSYGLELALPESDDRVRVRGVGAGEPSTALALQLDAEWARAGWRFDAETAPPSEDPSLAGVLADDARPDDLRPWLGQTGVAPGGEDGLPPGFVLSATRLGTFTTCLYRGWAGSVLGLRAPETLEEDLGAKEIGTAAHSVLEAVGAAPGERPLLRRVVSAQDVPAAREQLAAACAGRTAVQVEATREAQGARSETGAARAARKGLVGRWERHWPVYADDAVQAADEVRSKRCEGVGKGLDKELSAAALDALAGGQAASTTHTKVGPALRGVVAQARSLEGIRERWDEVVAKATKGDQPKLTAGIASPPPELLALIEEARTRLADLPSLGGDGDTIAVEAAFGEDGASIPLGHAPVLVRGKIDAILRWQTDQSPYLEVCDYKTGAAGSGGKERDVLQTLARPQLPFYALAVREGLVPLAPVDAAVPVRSLSYGMVKDCKTTTIPLLGDALDAVQRRLGAILDRARDGDFPLRPLEQACPLLRGCGAFCDFAEACRLRALPVPGVDLESEGGEE